MKKGKLTLVGAGPGDPELITLKGIKVLKKADVVLYDALTHPELLHYTRTNALCISVGKRSGKHSFTQMEINQLIVKYARSHGHVVRLKGGDPFVFARGQEEIEYAKMFGVETEVIIGVSSINLGGLYDIPLTKRGINESFWVVTATTSDGTMSDDVNLVAQSSATGVFLMGLKKLEAITHKYQQYGKTQLPVAVISNGSLPEAEVVFGTIGTIEELVLEGKVKSPAIIIVGEVVNSNRFSELSGVLHQKHLQYA